MDLHSGDAYKVPRQFDGITQEPLGGYVTCGQQAHQPVTIEETIAEMFKYHPPSLEQLPRYDAIRTAAKHFAEIMVKNTPEGADRTAALRKLRECVMTANGAIALEGLLL